MIPLLALALQRDWDNARDYLRDALAAEGYASPGTSTALHRALPYGVRAAHSTDGSVYLDLRLGIALQEWADGGRQERHVDALRVLVHEELHGIGPATPAAYTGIGVAVEEVTTELVAHDLLRGWGVYPPRFAYAEDYDRLVWLGKGRASRGEMTFAARAYKRLPAGTVTTAEQARATFAALLATP